MTLDSLIADAAEELLEWYQNNPEETEPHDRIFELADAHTPIYYSELLRLAAENNSLALDVPECGPAFDGKPTPINIIAGNCFEAIEAGLWQAWQELIDEEDDDDAD